VNALLLLAALAAEPASVEATVTPVVAVLPRGAALTADPAFEGPPPAGDPCPRTALRDASGEGAAAAFVSACDGAAHVLAEGAWTRLDGALPEGPLAAVRVRRAPDGELVVVAWTATGFLRTTAWSPGDPPPFTVATRRAPLGPPLPWPTATPAVGPARARLDARLEADPRVLAVRVDGTDVVLSTRARGPGGDRIAEVRVARQRP
jgi:hypothetical protein